MLNNNLRRTLNTLIKEDMIAPSIVDTENLDILYTDFINIFCTQYKHGAYRVVFTPTCTEDIVIKISVSDDTNKNVIEMENYRFLCNHYPTIAEYYAPCIDISSNGKVLIQKRMDTLYKRGMLSKNMPKKVPAAFCLDDCHSKNFGFIGDQLVCCDYSFPKTVAYANLGLVPFKVFKKALSNTLSWKEIVRILNKQTPILDEDQPKDKV